MRDLFLRLGRGKIRDQKAGRGHRKVLYGLGLKRGNAGFTATDHR